MTKYALILNGPSLDYLEQIGSDFGRPRSDSDLIALGEVLLVALEQALVEIKVLAS